MKALRDLWNETLAEPVPQHLLDIVERAAAFTLEGEGGGMLAPELTDSGPNCGEGSLSVPRPSDAAPHNRCKASTPLGESGSR